MTVALGLALWGAALVVVLALGPRGEDAFYRAVRP